MRTIKFSAVMAIALSLLFITSCKKDDDFTTALDYLNDITGNYEGTFTRNNKKVGGDTAYAEIRHINGNLLEIHCFGDLLDTTFVMEMYANQDSIMLCATGSDFENIYGHEQGEYHMNHHKNGENEWMHHQSDNHNSGDEHYGGFNLTKHQFYYRFVLDQNVPSETIIFNGNRTE